MIDKNLLKQECLKYDIELTNDQIDCLDEFSEILIEWNEKFNLTAIKEPDQIVYKHFIDSLLVLKAIELKDSAKLADIGTGAGFPSTPVSIVRRDINITQVDSLRKRVGFLQHVSDHFNLNVRAVHGRAEDLGQKDEYREQFKYVTARAVAPLQKLVEYCLPLVRVDGVFVAMKGSEYELEIDNAKNAIGVLGGKIEDVKNFKLPDSSDRNIILIKKISHTPTKYPRNSSKISKKPI